jgi:hypothetical protein
MDETTFNEIIAMAKDYKLKQQNEVVRYLVSTAYSFGYKAGIESQNKTEESK